MAVWLRKAIVVLIAAGAAVAAVAAQQPAGTLVQLQHFSYEGAFRVPPGRLPTLSPCPLSPAFGIPCTDPTFGYNGQGLAFLPKSGTLLLSGHGYNQQVAEISIPELRKGALDQLAVSELRTPFVDVTGGKMGSIASANTPQTMHIGGLLSYGGRLLASAYIYYDGGNQGTKSHFIAETDDLKALGRIRGAFQVSTVGAAERLTNAASGGLVGGYMADIPAEWQAALGGTVLTGQCCVSVIGRSSHGPAVFAFDPGQMTTEEAVVPAQPLVYYSKNQPNALGIYNARHGAWNGTTQMGGVVLPRGTRSVMFFGRHGLGPYCYGLGVNTGAENAPEPPDDGAGTKNCFDPTQLSKGDHAFPYRYHVWAYDANDLALVKAGKRRPWEVKPYSIWNIDLPYRKDSAKVAITGVAYDAASGRIFLAQAFGDGDRPVIHVLTLRGV